PLLKRTSEVRVVWLSPERDIADPGAEIAQTLSRHSINAIAEPIRIRGEGAGEALMRKAADIGAGLLVMGAWGHSRLRQFILGGATRSVIAHMHCPVLLSH